MVEVIGPSVKRTTLGWPRLVIIHCPPGTFLASRAPDVPWRPRLPVGPPSLLYKQPDLASEATCCSAFNEETSLIHILLTTRKHHKRKPKMAMVEQMVENIRTSENLSPNELERLRSMLPEGWAANNRQKNASGMTQLEVILDAIDYIKTLQEKLKGGRK